MNSFHTIKWLDPGLVSMIDQRKLPHEVVYREFNDPVEVASAIKDMVIRGAPAIGAAAAYGLALVPWHDKTGDLDQVNEKLKQAARILSESRPTAVNLFWAIRRMMDLVEEQDHFSVSELKVHLLQEAQQIAEDDIKINQSIGKHALPLIPEGAVIFHHCNTGSLATVDYGTALGVIRMAPWELLQYGVPFKVVVDSASGHYMRTEKIDLCVVGTDRVAANGDVANKIGTYNLAVVAHENIVPFYVAVPKSTIDMNTPSGDQIKIEERPPEEVTHVGHWQITPDGTPVGNPAFDITPAKYITALITEDGLVYPPYEENLAKLFRGKEK